MLEMMGQPSDQFYDFRDRAVVLAWRDFASDLARHLIDRYGREEVLSWYFETSNEPDVHGFWEQGAQAFLNYYDATAEGLRAVDPDIVFGGPGTSGRGDYTLKHFLEHVESGTSAVSGGPAPRLDFISVHKKDAAPKQMEREAEVMAYIRRFHPGLADLPFMNNEADPIGGWGIPYWWRPGPWHAAFVAQAVDLRYRVAIDALGFDYDILSNDNGFMGSWGKRTQLARFLPGDNDVDQRGSSYKGGRKVYNLEDDPRPVTDRFFLVKKPVLTVMTLLEFLGERRYPVHSEALDALDHLGCIASSRADGVVAVLCYNAPDIRLMNGYNPQMEPADDQVEIWDEQSGAVRLSLGGLGFDKAELFELSLDNIEGHAYRVWRDLGAPQDPSADDYRAMSAAMEPGVSGLGTLGVADGEATLEIDLPSSSVKVVLIAPEALARPQRPGALEAHHYAGLNGERQVMLTWDGADEELTWYEVWFAAAGTEKFERVSPAPLLDRGWLHLAPPGGGRYRVRAVNFHGEAGEFSKTLTDRP
jgi:L-iduronidase